jgi:hypothetical protein
MIDDYYFLMRNLIITKLSTISNITRQHSIRGIESNNHVGILSATYHDVVVDSVIATFASSFAGGGGGSDRIP